MKKQNWSTVLILCWRRILCLETCIYLRGKRVPSFPSPFNILFLHVLPHPQLDLLLPHQWSVGQMQWAVFCPYLTWSFSNTGYCWLLPLLQFLLLPFVTLPSPWFSSPFLLFFWVSLWSRMFLSLGFSCQLYLYALLRWAPLTFRLQKPLLAYSWKIHAFIPDLALLRASYLLAVSTWMVGREPSISPSISILRCSTLLRPVCAASHGPLRLVGSTWEIRGKEDEGRVCLPRPRVWSVSRLLAGDLLQTALSDKVRNC